MPTDKTSKIKNGSIVALIVAHSFRTLTDDGFKRFTLEPGTVVQVVGEDWGVQILKGRFMSWVAREKVRPATPEECEDFRIAGGEREPKPARRPKPVASAPIAPTPPPPAPEPLRTQAALFA